MTIHMKVDSIHPAIINTLCGISHYLNAWKRCKPIPAYTINPQEVTCKECKATIERGGDTDD